MTPDDMPEGRALGIDYGLRRIGVALGDASWTLASPLTTLVRRRGKRPPFRLLAELAAEHGATVVVVGLPLDQEGLENDWTREVRAFAEKLWDRIDGDIVLHDERFSSVVAENRIRSIGLPKSRREDKARIDAGAAAVILQSWLDAEKSD